MNQYQTRYQTDLAGVANNMMTQMICKEKGIDYTQLMMMAQQQHISNIVASEQQRQLDNIIKRHYQGNSGSFFAKLRDAFTPEPNMGMVGFPSPTIPLPTPVIHQAQSPADVANLFAQPINPAPIPFANDDNARINNLEKDMAELKNMIAGLAGALQK